MCAAVVPDVWHDAVCVKSGVSCDYGRIEEMDDADSKLETSVEEGV